LGGIGIWTAFAPAIISKKAWYSLTTAEQEALEQASATSNIYFEATQRESEEDTIAAFTKAGAKVQPLTFEDYAAWLHVANDTSWKKYQSVSPMARQLFTALLQSFISSDSRPRPGAGSQGAPGGSAAGGPR
jgi:TRAP-type C4-dicarboxylate transport system substrate-binding protein